MASFGTSHDGLRTGGVIMPKRICDACGKEKRVRGGKTCPNGHFICADCVYGGLFGPTRAICPLCGKPLR